MVGLGMGRWEGRVPEGWVGWARARAGSDVGLVQGSFADGPAPSTQLMVVAIRSKNLYIQAPDRPPQRLLCYVNL